MKIDVRAIAEEQNWFVTHHWADGLDLPLFGLPIGPILTYNLLQVANHHWLDQWDEEAAEYSRAQEAAKAERDAQEAARKAQEAAAVQNTEPNPPAGPPGPATPQPDPATAGVEALAAPAVPSGEEAIHGA